MFTVPAAKSQLMHLLQSAPVLPSYPRSILVLSCYVCLIFPSNPTR
jgi:hypothetical protein